MSPFATASTRKALICLRIDLQELSPETLLYHSLHETSVPFSGFDAYGDWEIFVKTISFAAVRLPGWLDEWRQTD
jgi:hypothetical protein